ncbi:MAG TPA: hypothetical protein DF613_13465 [Lachnospiraceae bacterium]|nr:hypothetical protein [Lachnospiraceae bacterium]
MPHITVRGVKEKELTAMAPMLKQTVTDSAGVKAEYVKVFHSPVKRVDAPQEVAVDVYWMPRPQELCDAVAKAVTEFMKMQGKDFVQVTFTEFPGSHFYENNVHY